MVGRAVAAPIGLRAALFEASRRLSDGWCKTLLGLGPSKSESGECCESGAEKDARERG